MRNKGTFILFVIAAALAAYYWLVERPRGHAEHAARVAAARLSDFEPDDVVSLTIERSADSLSFARDASSWVMTRPVEDLADPGAVTRLLAAWSESGVVRDLGAVDDRARYGLDSVVAVSATTGSGRVLSLYLGGYTVEHEYVYASREPGGDVLLVPTALRRYASADVEDFRGKRVIAFDPSVVDSFTVDSPHGVMHWARAGETWHTIIGGHRVTGDPDSVDTFLRTLRALRVWAFPTEAEVRGAFASAEAALRGDVSYAVRVFKSPPNPHQLLELTRRGQTALARRIDYVEGPAAATLPGNGRVVEVDTTAMEVFDGGVFELREKHLLRIDPGRVTRVSLTSPDTIATIVRVANTWTYPNPALGTIESSRVRPIFDWIARISFDEVVREAPAALDGAPTFTLALYDDGGTLVDELACVAHPGGSPSAIATSRSLGLVARIDARELDALVRLFRRINR